MLRRHHVGRLLSGGDTPFSFDEKLIFFRASDLDGLNNNDPVTTWPDLFPNGWDATQSAPSLQPIYKTNAINGKPALSFNGNTEWMSLGSNYPFIDSSKTGLTAFAVVQCTSSAGNDFVFDFGNLGTAGYGLIFQNALQFMYSPTASGGCLGPNINPGTISGSVHLIAGVWEFGVSQRIYLDNVLVGTQPCAGLTQMAATEISNAPTRQLSSGPYCIGIQSKTASDGGRLFTGFLPEHSAYSKAFSVADLTKYWEYAQQEYAL